MYILQTDLKTFLDEKADHYNNVSFIENDPIAIPHSFSIKRDREIMGFFSAMLAWGQRKTILSKCRELAARFGNEPYRFVMEHSDGDLENLLGFRHRTFNDTDLLYFVDFFKRHYAVHDSLEEAFLSNGTFRSIEDSLIGFERTFFGHPDAPGRTRKHVATPARNSACKRLNMFLRWMVRKDDKGVDFGLWERIPQSALICPIDLHVDRTARRLGLIIRKQTDWKTAVELTENLRLLDSDDPVKYDFALFGLSVDQY
jgi:TIGR02757 family protein